jgi:multidrug resistance protein MdtO
LISGGVIIATGAQLLLWPTDPERLLRDLLAARFDASARVVRGLLTGGASAELASEEFVRRGLLRQLELIRTSEARHPALRHRHVEQLALIGAAEHVLTAAAAVARLAPDPGSLGAAVRDRLERVASQSERLAVALRARSESVPPPAPRDVADEAVAAAGGTALLGGLLEMERSLAQATSALAPSAASMPASVAAVHFDVPEDGSFFTPACSASNHPELVFALKAGIAATILQIVVEGLAWPGIDTAIWTSLLVAQSSVGGIVQKSILRLAGAALGGLLALATTVLVVPNGETLASMLLAVGAGATVAAWLNTGSPRIAYAGMQTGLAFGLTIIDSFRPAVKLTVARDRLLGIFLGIVVTGLVFAVSGHRLARDALRGALAKALRSLAELARVGIGAMDPIAAVDPVRGHRWSVYSALAATLALDEEARYEAGAQRSDILALRAGVLAAANRALGVMLALLAVVRHRLDVTVRPDPALHERVRTLALGIVETFETLADRLDGRASAALPDLPGLLSAAESAPRDPPAVHLNARLALYRALVEALEPLVRDVGQIVSLRSAMPAHPPGR